MIKIQTLKPEEITKKLQTKILHLKENQTDPLIITQGSIQSLDFNDDIKREQEFYNITLQNYKVFKNANKNIKFGRLDTEYLIKNIDDVIHNPIIKSAVHIKNIEEKELNQQGKKIQNIINIKNTDKVKQQKLIEEIKKAMKKQKKNDEFDKEEIQEIQQNNQHKQRQNTLNKSIKKKKTKRFGKRARLNQKLKQNSKKHI